MPLLGIDYKKYFTTTGSIKEITSGFSQASGNINGVKLCGPNGTSKIETKRWIDTLNSKDFILFSEINGAGADDVEIQIEACLSGGESNPDVIIDINPTTSENVHSFELTAYDRVRANIVKHKEAGAGSQIIMSGR